MVNLIYDIKVRDAEGMKYGLLILSVVFIGIFIWLWYKARASRFWAKGIFPPFLKFNEKNLIEAYSALGALMMTIDHDTPREKVDFILKHFTYSFQFVHNNFRENLIYAMKHRVTPKSVTDWINKQLLNQKEKKKIIEFIAGVGLVDGDLTRNEVAFLKMTNTYLGLSPTVANEIIAKHISNQNKAHKKAQKPSTRNYSFNAHSVLGVKSTATAQEIKKAYRNLVKIHHPDNFAKASKTLQDNAEERFLEIQKAYEDLTD